MEARAAPALPIPITTATATSGSSKGAKQTNTPLATTSPTWALPVLAPAETMQSLKSPARDPLATRSPMPFFTAATVSSERSRSDRTWGSWV